MCGRPSLWWRVRHAWSVRVVWLAVRRDERCRASDRIEAAAVVGVAVVLLVSVPLAVVLGLATMSRSLSVARQQQLDRHRTVATVVTSKTDQPNAAYPAMSQVMLAWRTGAGATERDSTVTFGAPKVGSRMTIWTARDGRRVDPPLSALQAAVRGCMAVLLTLALVLMSAFALLASTRWALMRVRIRDWDAEWVEVASDRPA